MIQIPDDKREILWPATEIYATRMFDSKHDLVIVVGHEPQLHWRTFTDQIVEIANN